MVQCSIAVCHQTSLWYRYELNYKGDIPEAIDKCGDGRPWGKYVTITRKGLIGKRIIRDCKGCTFCMNSLINTSLRTITVKHFGQHRCRATKPREEVDIKETKRIFEINPKLKPVEFGRQAVITAIKTGRSWDDVCHTADTYKNKQFNRNMKKKS